MVGARVPGEQGWRSVSNYVPLPDCDAEPPIVAFAEVCMHVDVSLTRPSSATWPYGVRILVGRSDGVHSVHVLNPGERKTVRVPSFAENRAVVNGRNRVIGEYRDTATRPCPSPSGSSSSGGSGTPGRAARGPAGCRGRVVGGRYAYRPASRR